jgi:hypothetical protein
MAVGRQSGRCPTVGGGPPPSRRLLVVGSPETTMATTENVGGALRAAIEREAGARCPHATSWLCSSYRTVGSLGTRSTAHDDRWSRRAVISKQRVFQRRSHVFQRRLSHGLRRNRPLSRTLSRTMSFPVPFVSIRLPAGGCHSWAILLSSVCSVCSVDCLLLSAFRSLLVAFEGMFQTSEAFGGEQIRPHNPLWAPCSCAAAGLFWAHLSDRLELLQEERLYAPIFSAASFALPGRHHQ